MEPDVLPPDKGSRTRYLNIVYFIDSSKSHSLRINLVIARWILAILVGLTLWGFISVAWVVSLTQIVTQTRRNLREALTGVYEYQVKYENLFESSYSPDQLQKEVASTNSKVDSTKQVSRSTTEVGIVEGSQANLDQNTDASREVKSSAKKSDLPSNSISTNSQLKSDPDVSLKPAQTLKSVSGSSVSSQPTQTELMIDMSIKNSVLVRSSGVVKLSFDIVNQRQSDKAEGYIWAIAEFQETDNPQLSQKIIAPQHATLTPNGEVQAFKSTYKFSIQRFKSKDFTFQIPTMKKASLKKVVIVFTDLNNTLHKTNEVPIPSDFLGQIDSKNEKISH